MADRDYEVGYGRPPKHSQFKPGRSGNKGGRPKGSRGLRTELDAELNERMMVTENGKSRKMPKRRVVIKALTAKAVKGDVRAADRLLNLSIQANGFEDRQKERDRLNAADRQIVELLLGQIDPATIALLISSEASNSDPQSGDEPAQ
jgi:hypothetical protein